MSNNDWLKYNASEYQVGDKVYRNLEAQVLKNKEDIEAFDVSGLEDDVEALQGDVEQLQTDVAGKQDKLTAGSNVTITGNTISATNTTYEAGEGIEIVGNVINAIGGGTVDVFWVTPNTTTYAQITTALSEDKLPLINASGVIYVFNCDMGNDSYLFTNADAMQKQFFTYTVTDANVWSTGSRSMQDWYLNTGEVTIQPSDWTLVNGVYLASITLSGMTLDAAVVWASPKAYADMIYWAESQVFCSTHGLNQIRFITTNTPPTHNIHVNVVWTAEAS